MIKAANLIKSLATTLAIAFSASAQADQAPDWVFMDLGEVIVTGNATDGYLYVPGARELIDGLHAAGVKVALISNIPESWGATCDAKFTFLQSFIDQYLLEPVPFAWNTLDTVILPPFDRYRKPAPLMFMNALATACPGKAIFIGEDSDEVAAAAALGFASIDTSARAGLPSVSEVLSALASDFSFSHPQGCVFEALLNDALLPRDIGLVNGCVVTP